MGLLKPKSPKIESNDEPELSREYLVAVVKAILARERAQAAVAANGNAEELNKTER